MTATAALGSDYGLVDGTTIVRNVIVADPSIIANPLFLSRFPGTWVAVTSGPLRGAIGFTWTGMQFQPPQPYPSWAWSITAQSWVPPVALPPATANGLYSWNEPTLTWILIPFASSQSLN